MSRDPVPRGALGGLAVVTAAAVAVSAALANRGFYTLDEGSLLAIADRLAQGQVLYRDVCSAVFPGTFYLLAASFRIFGASLAVERGVAFAIFVATATVLYLLGRRVASPQAALAGALAFVASKPVLFPLHTVLNYSQASFLFAVLALLVAAGPATLPRAAAAGVLAALCGLFKQNYGAYTVVSVLLALAIAPGVLLRRRIVHLATFLAVGAAAALPALLWLASAGAWPELWRNCVKGPVAIVPGAYVVPWAPLVPSVDLHVAPRVYLPSPVADILLPWLRSRVMEPWPFLVPLAIRTYYLLPLACIGAALASPLRRRLLPLAVLDLLLYGALFPRTDFAHLTALAPLSCLLLAAAMDGLPSAAARGARAAFVLVNAAIGGFHLWLIVTTFTTPLLTSRGTLLVAEDQAQRTRRILDAIERHVPAGEPLFVAPVDAGISFLSRRRNPTRFDYLEPVNMGDAQARETVTRLAQTRFVVLSDRDLTEMRVPPVSAYAAPLQQHLLASFEPIWEEVDAFDEVHLCRRVPPEPPPAVDLALLPVRAEVLDVRGVASPAPDGSVRLSEVLASRTLEVLPPADATAALRLGYDLEVPAGAVLRVTLAGRPSTFWRGSGPGMAFRGLVALEGGPPERLFDVLLDPGTRPTDRPGRRVEVDLYRHAGRRVRLMLEAQAPASLAVRGYGFREPAIVVREPAP